MSLDDVNRQHMAAMGLDPESLGKAAPRRCSSRQSFPTIDGTTDSVRCENEEGHSGRHAYGIIMWDSVEDKSDQCTSRHIVDAESGMRVRCTEPRGHASAHEHVSEVGTYVWSNTFKQREGDQPLPVVNDHPDIQAAVIADIEIRREVGIQRYGTALQPNNGRDMLLDAYEEALDLAIYLKGALVERDLKAAQDDA